MRRAGATLHRGARASHCCGLSLQSTGSRRAGSVIVAHGPSCSAACGNLPRPGLEPVSPALAGRFSTTAPPGKPPAPFLEAGANVFLLTYISPYFFNIIIYLFYFIYLFWPHWVLAVACGIFVALCRLLSCGMRTLSCGMHAFPNQGSNPGPPALGAGVLPTGPPGKSLPTFYSDRFTIMCFTFLSKNTL